MALAFLVWHHFYGRNALFLQIWALSMFAIFKYICLYFHSFYNLHFKVMKYVLISWVLKSCTDPWCLEILAVVFWDILWKLWLLLMVTSQNFDHYKTVFFGIHVCVPLLEAECQQVIRKWHSPCKTPCSTGWHLEDPTCRILWAGIRRKMGWEAGLGSLGHWGRSLGQGLETVSWELDTPQSFISLMFSSCWIQGTIILIEIF